MSRVVTAREHSRSRCVLCDAELVFLVGDPTVGYEDIHPIEGGPRTLVEHTDERCRFHQFLTPSAEHHTLPGNASWLDKVPINPPRRQRFGRWVRTDE